MTNSFKKFMEDVFMKECMVTKDDFEDEFETWLEKMGFDLLALYADKYAIIRMQENSEEIFTKLKQL